MQRSPQTRKLTDAQIRLLTLFQQTTLPDDVWNEVQDLITQRLAEQVTEAANEAVEEKGWTEADWHRLLHTHQRTPY